MQLVAEVRAACAALPGTTETFPFDTVNLVFKVGGPDPEARGRGDGHVWRMYAMVNITEDPLRLVLKCDPARSARLRDAYPQVRPAAYFAGHWNVVPLDASLPDDLVLDLLTHSYDLVVRKNLPRRVREALGLA